MLLATLPIPLTLTPDTDPLRTLVATTSVVLNDDVLVLVVLYDDAREDVAVPLRVAAALPSPLALASCACADSEKAIDIPSPRQTAETICVLRMCVLR